MLAVITAMSFCVAMAACGSGGPEAIMATELPLVEQGVSSVQAMTPASEPQSIATGSISEASSSSAATPDPASTPVAIVPPVQIAQAVPPQAEPQEPAGSSSSQPASQAKAWIQISPGDTIEYYGDSTVYGNLSGVGTQVSQPPPYVFSKVLGHKYIVKNEGVSATTSTQLLLGTDGKHAPWATQMANSPARVVIINHAMNDKVYTTVSQYTNNLRKLAEIAIAKNKQVIFETPNPDYWGGLEPYMSAMKAVALQLDIPVIDQFSYLKAFLNGRSVYEICPDGTHPSEAAYVLKGTFAAQKFTEFTTPK